MKKRFFRDILPHRFLPILILAAQAGLLFHVFLTKNPITEALSILLELLSLLLCLRLISSDEKAEFKIGWILLLLLLPLFGLGMYGLFHGAATRRFGRRVAKSEAITAGAMPPSAPLANLPHMHAAQARYLTNRGFPLCANAKSTYYPLGDRAFGQMLADLEQAQNYIFLEYFILEEGQMWEQMLTILRKKAAQGVTVRVIYDDLGSFFLLCPDFPQRMEALGISCVAFNPFRPLLAAKQNNRDHRKILSVDGRIAYTGGINIADEYVGLKDRCGFWKDTALRLEGSGAWSLTVMFLQTWQLCTQAAELPERFRPAPCPAPDLGWVQPYCDSPTDKESVGEAVYLNLIHAAREYLYLTTPYLIPTDSLVSALVQAAKSGVDVRIAIPSVSDNKLAEFAGRSYYRTLLDGGVKLYRYDPGFIHAKIFLCDGTAGTVGTVNMDFRSLCLHFECGVCLYGTESLAAIRQDLDDVFAQSTPILPADLRGGFFTDLALKLLRLFAPLL